MEKFVDKKISFYFKQRDVEVKEAILSVEKGIWCLFSNHPEMNDKYRSVITNRRGYKYVWCFGISETPSEYVLANFGNLRLARKLNHEE